MPASRGIVVSYPAAGQSHYETKGVTHDNGLNFEGRITVKDEGSKEFSDAAARMENAPRRCAMRGASVKPINVVA